SSTTAFSSALPAILAILKIISLACAVKKPQGLPAWHAAASLGTLCLTPPSRWFLEQPEGRMPIDFSNAWNTGVRLVNQCISLIPNFVIACVIFVGFLAIGSFCKSLVRLIAVQRRKHQGIALLLGRLVHISIVILGFLVALSLIAPSFQA